MSCCAAGTEGTLEMERAAHALPSSEELHLSSRDLGDGLYQTELSVPGVHCGACIATIEKSLKSRLDVERARVNLSTKRVSIVWKAKVGQIVTDPVDIVRTVFASGYEAHLFAAATDGDEALRNKLMLAVAVAGFAASNIMLLSVSVWSGADAATRDMFHWLSAAIAAPAIIYAGRFFFVSAWNGLRHGRVNMDVPISLAVILAYSMSLWETVHHGEQAWFDASVTLLFLLLIGRTLDHVMRDRARSAITGLARLSPRGAMVVMADGGREYRPLADIAIGDRLSVGAGERVPVDSIVVSGVSDADFSIVNGESAAVRVQKGDALQAGILNLTGGLTLEASALARDSFLAEIMRLMEAAEGGKASYRRIADRAAEIYAPAVHLLAFGAFLFWGLYGGDWKHALLVAVAVLIITCPCALGLAVPVVQVVAAGRLFKAGIMVKDGSAMERLAEIDCAAFDKTGTLTLGRPRFINRSGVDFGHLQIAASLGSHSRHPLSEALYRSVGSVAVTFDDVREIPGSGIEAKTSAGIYRLGSRSFAGNGTTASEGRMSSRSEVVLSLDYAVLETFQFEDALRPGAEQALADFALKKIPVTILSGDRPEVVAKLATRLCVRDWKANLKPADKAGFCVEAQRSGHRLLMVGDGINDAPALSAAHVSMAPATAADIGRQAADFVFMHDSLEAVPLAIRASRKAGRLIRENFAIAIIYNGLAVPLALSGIATPLIAAIAMSTSSIIVVLNALRLNSLGSHLPVPKGAPTPNVAPRTARLAS